jgi:hypothetical protein
MLSVFNKPLQSLPQHSPANTEHFFEKIRVELKQINNEGMEYLRCDSPFLTPSRIPAIVLYNNEV